MLAGVRNSGLDESQRRCSDLHCSFGVRSSRAASSGCSARSRVRSSGGVPAALFVGTNGRRLRSAWKSKRALRFSSLADPMPRSLPALPGRRSRPQAATSTVSEAAGQATSELVDAGCTTVLITIFDSSHRH